MIPNERSYRRSRAIRWVYLAYLEEAGIEVAGFLDDTPEKQDRNICGAPVLGKTDLLEQLGTMGIDTVYVPLGNNRRRALYLDRARDTDSRHPVSSTRARGWVHGLP